MISAYFCCKLFARVVQSVQDAHRTVSISMLSVRMVQVIRIMLKMEVLNGNGKKISPAIKGVAAGEVSMIYNDGFIIYFSSQ